MDAGSWEQEDRKGHKTVPEEVCQLLAQEGLLLVRGQEGPYREMLLYEPDSEISRTPLNLSRKAA